TSRRSGSSSLLSFNPRTGRSGDRITAAANTEPKRAPRPTSSTPAMERNPRARNSRSIAPSQRILPVGGSASIWQWFDGFPPPWLAALFEASRFAFQFAEIVKLGAPYFSCAHYVDMIDDPRMKRKDTFHAVAEADLADRDRLAHSRVVT